MLRYYEIVLERSSFLGNVETERGNKCITLEKCAFKNH